MAKTYYDQDANFDLLKNKTVAIIGYGSQGHAHALNLKDSGVNVIVGLYEGSKSKAAAESHGLKVLTVAEAVKKADVTMILIPDEKQADVYKSEIAPNLKEGSALAFAHGFNIHFKQIQPPANVDVFMVAPKGPGHLVRRTFVEGGMAKMRRSVSDTAEYGDYVSGPRIVTPETKKEMKQVLAEIQDGTFAKNWLLENRAAGRANFLSLREQHANHQIEKVGKELRSMMSWLKGQDKLEF